jgi:DNA-binding MarR family transcriptional regulator
MRSLPGPKRGEVRNEEPAADSISTIETELLTLVRHLETHGRKSSLYVEVDRAGYLALRTLERLGPLHTNALAEALQLDASTVTRQVTALASSGFVERQPDPADGRSSNLAVTSAGRHIMQDVERERKSVLDDMFSDWGEDERRDLGRVLTKLNISLIDQVAAFRERTGPPDRAQKAPKGADRS